MSMDVLLLVFVAVSVIAFLLQCISLWRAAATARQIAERVEQRTEALDREIQHLMVRGRELSDSLEPLIRLGESINTNVEEISSLLKQRASDLDRFLEELMVVGRDQAAKIDYVVTDTVQKFEQTTDVIQKDVLQPAIEISSFFKGIKSGLEYLTSRKQGRPPQDSAEEGMYS